MSRKSSDSPTSEDLDFEALKRLQDSARASGVCLQLTPRFVYTLLRTPRGAHNVFRALHAAGIHPKHLAGVRVFADRLEVYLRPTGSALVDDPRPNATLCVFQDRLPEEPPAESEAPKVPTPDPVLLVRATPGFGEVVDGKEYHALEAVTYALAWYLRQFKVERLSLGAIAEANRIFWSKKRGGPLEFDVRRPLGVRDGLVICAHTARVAVRGFSVFDLSAAMLRRRESWRKLGRLTPPKKGQGEYAYTLGRKNDQAYVQGLNGNGVGCRRYFKSLAELGPRLRLKVRPVRPPLKAQAPVVQTPPSLPRRVRCTSSVPSQFTREVTDRAYRALMERGRKGTVNQYALPPTSAPQ